MAFGGLMLGSTMGIEFSGTVGIEPAGEFTIDGTVTITICPFNGSMALEE